MSAYLADSPLTCVVLGSGRSLEEIDVMRERGDGRRRLGGRR
jgi:rod shape-determining protein MreB